MAFNAPDNSSVLAYTEDRIRPPSWKMLIKALPKPPCPMEKAPDPRSRPQTRSSDIRCHWRWLKPCFFSCEAQKAAAATAEEVLARVDPSRWLLEGVYINHNQSLFLNEVAEFFFKHHTRNMSKLLRCCQSLPRKAADHVVGCCG